MRYYYASIQTVIDADYLGSSGLPTDPADLAAIGVYPIADDKPEYDAELYTLEPDGLPVQTGDTYTQHWRAVPLPTSPTDLLAQEKAAKRAELKAAFTAAEASGHLDSALGFPIDATDRANRDLAGLVTVMSQPGAPETTLFCDHGNQMHPVTLEQIRTMQLEVIAYGQSLYAQKWTLREAIETAETVDAVRAVEIAFGADAENSPAEAPAGATA